MTITTTLAACSQTVSSNGPDGAVDPPSTLDDAIRYSLSFVAQLRDTKSAIGANSDITSLSGLTSINGGPLAGFRNRIINGDMRIDQRNAGAAVTGVNSSVYVVDRFVFANSTATGTITGQQSTLNGAKSFLVTATSAVTDLTTNKLVNPCEQRIEGQNIFDLNSKAVSLSFKVQTNWSGKLAVAFRNGLATRSYVIDVAVTSGINNIVVPSVVFESSTVNANDNSTGIFVNIGFNNAATYQTATTGSWIAGVFLCSTQSTNWALTTGNYINVTEVQLEQGTVATSFERRPIGAELALCQRYYELVQYDFVLPSVTNGQGVLRFNVPFKVTKRGTPSGMVLSSGYVNGFATPSIYTSSTNEVSVQATVNGTNNSGEIAGNITIPAEL